MVRNSERLTIAALCANLLLGTLAGCGGGGASGPQPPPVTVTQVTVSAADLRLEVGTVTRGSVVVRNSDGSTTVNPSVSWTSSNNTIATVDATGEIRGVAPGGVVITAQSGGRHGEVALSVTNYAGTYTLITLDEHALPFNHWSESCVQLPQLPVCFADDFVEGGSLQLGTDRQATFTVLHRWDMHLQSGTTSSPATEVWTGTYTVSGTTIRLPMTSGGRHEMMQGDLAGGRATLIVSNHTDWDWYAFERH